MTRSRLLLVLVATLQLAFAQNNDRYIVTQETRIPPRASLRSRYASISPAELLQRVTAARAAFVTPDPTPPVPQQPETDEYAPTVRVTYAEITTLPSRSYRKQYSRDRRPAKQSDATDVRNLLKQFGPSSLSEVLQRKNITLQEFLQNKKLQLTLLSEQQSTEKPISTIEKLVSTTEQATTRSEISSTIRDNQRSYVSEQYHPVKRLGPNSSLYNVGQRIPYLQSKRVQQSTAPPVYHDTVPHRSTSDDDKRVDSREDILELLQPGSSVSLAAILSSRNMTLAELMEHRERGSRQQQLSELFHDVKFKNISEGSTSQPSSRRIDTITKSVLAIKTRGSRDPRLLDKPNSNSFIVNYEEIGDAPTTRTGPVAYDYEVEETESEEAELPVDVKSAILASSGLLGITLILFAAIFLCCKIRQRRRRGSRAPFLRNSKLARSERSVVIKPAEMKTNGILVDF